MPLLIAVTAVNLMSLLDGINTVLLVDDDSCVELNPLVSALMAHNYLSFFGTKLVLTLLGTVLCWHFYERRASARNAFKLISRIYCSLMIWQALLLTGVIS
jgi:hypothetical protein